LHRAPLAGNGLRPRVSRGLDDRVFSTRRKRSYEKSSSINTELAIVRDRC